MDTTDRTILKRFILSIVAILLIGVILWVFFFRDDAKKGFGANTKTDASAQKKEADPRDGAQQSAESGIETRGEPTNSGAQGNSQQRPDTLSDTGPGNAALLFSSAAVLGALAHHLYARKRPVRAS